MNCNNCSYNFAVLHKDYDGDKVDCKYEMCVHELKEIRKREHKCYGCSWGTWTGLKYKCSIPRCMPSLGNFGVDKNGQT